jgi:hypothetical protein
MAIHWQAKRSRNDENNLNNQAKLEASGKGRPMGNFMALIMSEQAQRMEFCACQIT